MSEPNEAATLLRRAINRLGWMVMGYPTTISWGRLVLDPTPGWERAYRWGARLANWPSPNGSSDRRPD